MRVTPPGLAFVEWIKASCGFCLLVPVLAFHGGEVEGVREGAAGEEAGYEEDPRAADATPLTVGDRETA